jgi:SAM-dependent methyltransferase
MTIDQQLLNTYFSGPWRDRHRGLEEFQYTGYRLVDKLKRGERVLDVGCGMNLFKDRWSEVTGIDPAFPEADYQLTINEYAEQYPEEKYDVAFCLGSINFGNFDDISNQITALLKVLKPAARIYWRCNPGLADHGNTECNSVPFFQWSFYQHAKLAELFGFCAIEIRWDYNDRIYAEWVRK